ncbi:MAG TPA: hypothetical protein VF400_01670, partial [Anaeromyxobacteraceae bacterium]
LLTLSLARRRMTFGESGPTFRAQEPSRFLGDLPPELFGLAARAAAAPLGAEPPRIRRHPGALDGEPVIELDGDDGWHAPGRSRSPSPLPSSRSPSPPQGERAGVRGAAPGAPGRTRGEPHVEYDVEEAAGLSPGDRVVHASLGEGVVRACEGRGGEAKVTVAFYDRGEKRVIARFLRRV